MTDMQAKPKRHELLIINDEEETPSILNPMSGQVFVTNRVGKRVMELADGGHTVEAIVEDISGRFKGAPLAVILQDVGTFLQEGTDKGLVSWVE